MVNGYFIMKHNTKNVSVRFNENRSTLEGRYNIETPHCYHLTCRLFFISHEDGRVIKRILDSVINRFKVYIKFNMCSKKEICIFDYTNSLVSGERFCLQVEYAGLIDEEMNKVLLLDKAERMAMLLEEFTRTLNSNWIILSQSRKGNRRKK